MEYPIPVCLLHLRVNVVTRIAQLSDLFRKQLHAVDRVAENDALIDFQFREQRVETVYLLPLLHIGIELSDTAESQFIHQVDTVGTGDKLLAESFDGDWERGTKQADLVLWVAVIDDLLQYRLKFRRKKLVCFIHNDSFDLAQVCHFLG